jgi:16S rRNA G527 N7-methylase RsmG
MNLLENFFDYLQLSNENINWHGTNNISNLLDRILYEILVLHEPQPWQFFFVQ